MKNNKHMWRKRVQHVDMAVSTYKASLPSMRARNFKLRSLLACRVCVCLHMYRFWDLAFASMCIISYACTRLLYAKALQTWKEMESWLASHHRSCNVISSFFTLNSEIYVVMVYRCWFQDAINTKAVWIKWKSKNIRLFRCGNEKNASMLLFRLFCT